ncbi:ileal sodium/bile acid cotransporter-like isoform X2 [Dermacentor variabilis]|uniref:ileal sodium/bile acid cotransporter-like isoform X2 n=1 Tax=Dermacentor variabilis TaxID=34621 RepID=UPI003F5BE4F7
MLNVSADSNFSNSTNLTDGLEANPVKYPLIKIIHDWLIVGILVSIMFGMGCHVKVSELWAHLRRPFGVAVGMLCQFVMMPLLAFGLLTCMRLSGLYAIGMLIMACCPGGTVSNVFAYFVDGDVPLSIAMTLCSTVLAMGMMPVNMLMYGYYVDTGDIVVPYSKMAMSLVFISLPAGLGMLFNWFCPRVAPYITKLSSTLGGLLIVVTQIMEVFIFPDIFHNIPPVLYAATVVMPAAGMMIGYLISWLFKRPDAVRKTIAIESGIQNVGMGLTIVSLSFKFQEQKQALLFPWLYGFTMIALSFLLCGIYGIYKKIFSKSSSHNIAAEAETTKHNEKMQLSTVQVPSHGVFNAAFQG